MKEKKWGSSLQISNQQAKSSLDSWEKKKKLSGISPGGSGTLFQRTPAPFASHFAVKPDFDFATWTFGLTRCGVRPTT